MTAWSSGLPPALGVMLLLALMPILVHSAPLAEQSTEMDSYYPVADSTGCYYNFQHYDEGDRIITNEPCLNCTCHNRMLMCYLRVCPFTKAIGQDCTVEKRPDQCCPVITCPEVPVQLLPSTTPSTALGHLNEYGCFIDNLFYSDGARVPSSPNSPCELCYCIRNRTACVMQECTLKIEGCKPVYQEGVCCPVKYDCDHPEENLLETTTTPKPTTGLIFTTTMQPGSTPECVYNNEIYADGALIKKDTPCEHCYCMKGDIVCAVQECSPTPLDKVNCIAVPPREDQCCTDTYDCDNIIEHELTTLAYGDYYTTASPEPTRPDESVNEEENELLPTLHPSYTGKPFEGEQPYTYAPGLTKTPETEEQGTGRPELGQAITGRPSETEQTQPHTYLPPTTELPFSHVPDLEGQATGKPFEIGQTHLPSATEGPSSELPEGEVHTEQPEGEQTESHTPVPSATKGPLTELPERGIGEEQTEPQPEIVEATGQPEVTEPYPHTPLSSEGPSTVTPESAVETTVQPGGPQTHVPPGSEVPSTEISQPEVTGRPGAEVTGQPEVEATGRPEVDVTGYPEVEVTGQPEAQATGQPEVASTGQPEVESTRRPATEVTGQPGGEVTGYPEVEVTGRPGVEVTEQQGEPQTHVPLGGEAPSTETSEPEVEVTGRPEVEITGHPEVEATGKPEIEGTGVPEVEVTGHPEVEVTGRPEVEITGHPEVEATRKPEVEITGHPEVEVTGHPEAEVTDKPEVEATDRPEIEGTGRPEAEVTGHPEVEATEKPDVEITGHPEVEVTSQPEVVVTGKPEVEATGQPEIEITGHPVIEATGKPEVEITGYPEVEVTGKPEVEDTGRPEIEGTDRPEVEATRHPEVEVSGQPEVDATGRPEIETTSQPEVEVTGHPEVEATHRPEVTEQPGEPQTHVPLGGEVPSTEISKPEVEITGRPDVEVTGHPAVEITGHPELEITGKPEVGTTGQPDIGHTVEGEQPETYTHIPSASEGPITEHLEPGAQVTTEKSLETEATLPHTYLPPTTEISATGATEAPEIEAQATGHPEVTYPPKGTEIPDIAVTGRFPELSTEGPRIPGEGHVPKVDETTEQPVGQTPQETEHPAVPVTEEPYVPEEHGTEGIPHVPEEEHGTETAPFVPGEVTSATEPTGIPEEHIPQGTERLPYPATELPEEETTAGQPEVATTRRPETEVTGQPEVETTGRPGVEVTTQPGEPQTHVPLEGEVSSTEVEGTGKPEVEVTGRPEVEITDHPEVGVTGHPEVEGTRKPEVDVTGRPEVEVTGVTGHPEVEVTGHPELEVTGKPEIEITGHPEVTVTGKPEVETTGRPEVEGTGKPEVEVTGRPEVEITDHPEVGVTGHPEVEGTRKPEVDVTGRPEVEVTGVTGHPEVEVTGHPEVTVTGKPEVEATGPPEVEGTGKPEVEVTGRPEVEITEHPEVEVTGHPEVEGTRKPEVEVTSHPEVEVTGHPEVTATGKPEVEATGRPEVEGTGKPEVEVTGRPEVEITEHPEVEVTGHPEVEGTRKPEVEVTGHPEVEGTGKPEVEVTGLPEIEVTGVTGHPEVEVTVQPEIEATGRPEVEVTGQPEVEITSHPEITVTGKPEVEATGRPEVEGTGKPEVEVTGHPEVEGTGKPEVEVTGRPEVEVTGVTGHPEVEVTGQPEVEATGRPEVEVTGHPEVEITGHPEVTVTGKPEVEATGRPEVEGTGKPEVEVTSHPEVEDTGKPEVEVTGRPEVEVSGVTDHPEVEATGRPEGEVTERPEVEITGYPETDVTGRPEVEVTGHPKVEVTGQPEGEPTGRPEVEVSGQPEIEVTGRPEVGVTGQPEVETTSRPGVEQIPTEGYVHVTEEPVAASTIAEHIPVESYQTEEVPETSEGPVVVITQTDHAPSQEQSTVGYPQTGQTEPHTYLPPITETPVSQIPEGATGQPVAASTEGEPIPAEGQRTEAPGEYKPTEISPTERLPERTEKPAELVTEEEYELTKQPTTIPEHIPGVTEEYPSVTMGEKVTEEHVPEEVRPTEGYVGITEEPIVAATEEIHIPIEGEHTEEPPYVTEKEHVPVEGEPPQVTEEPAITGTHKLPEPEEHTPITEGPTKVTEQPLEGHPESTIKPTEITTEAEHTPAEAEATEKLPHVTEEPVSITDKGEAFTGVPEVPTTEGPIPSTEIDHVIPEGVTSGRPEITGEPGVSVTVAEHIPESEATTLAPTVQVQVTEGGQVAVQVVTEGAVPTVAVTEGGQIPIQIVTDEALPTKPPHPEAVPTETEGLPTEPSVVTEEGYAFTTSTSISEHPTYPHEVTEHIAVHVTPEGDVSVTKLPPILQPEGFETTKHPSVPTTEAHIPVEIKPEGETPVTKVPSISATEPTQEAEVEVSATEQVPTISPIEGEHISTERLPEEGEPTQQPITEGVHPGLPEGEFETTKQPISTATQTEGESTKPTEGEFVPVEVIKADASTTAHPEISATAAGTVPGEEGKVTEGYTTQEPLPGQEGTTEHVPGEVPEHGVPGEGSCLVDGQTYDNNSSVPPINHCQISCKCISSILQCETVTCSPAPSNLHNCMPVYQGPDSCCPTYSCTVPETPEIESDSHKMEGTTTYQTPTEQPITIPISILPPEIETTLKPETEIPVGSTERLPQEQVTSGLTTSKPERLPPTVGIEHVTEYTSKAPATEGGIQVETEGPEPAVSTEHISEVEVTKGISEATEQPPSKPSSPESIITEGVEYTTGYTSQPTKPVTEGEIHVEEGQTTEPVTGYPNTTPTKSFEHEDQTTSKPPGEQVTTGIEYTTALPEHETEHIPSGIDHETGTPSKPAVTETVSHEGSTLTPVPEEYIPEHTAQPTEQPEYITEPSPGDQVTEGEVHITGTSKPSDLITQPAAAEHTPETHITEGPQDGQASQTSEGPTEASLEHEISTEQVSEGPVTEGIEPVTVTSSKPTSEGEVVTSHATGRPSQPSEFVTEPAITEEQAPDVHVTTPQISVTESVESGTGTPQKPSEELTPPSHVTEGLEGSTEKVSGTPVTESVEEATKTSSEVITEQTPAVHVTEGVTVEQRLPEFTEAVVQPTEHPQLGTEKLPEGQVTEGTTVVTGVPSKPSELVTEPIISEEITPEVTEGAIQVTKTPLGEGAPQTTVTEGIEEGTVIPSKPSESTTEHELPQQETTTAAGIETSPHEEHIPRVTEGIPQSTKQPAEYITEGPIQTEQPGVATEVSPTEEVPHISSSTTKPSELETELPGQTPAAGVTEVPHEEHVPEHTEGPLKSTEEPEVTKEPIEGIVTEAVIPEEQTPISHVTEKIPEEEHIPEATGRPEPATEQAPEGIEHVAGTTPEGVEHESAKPTESATEGIPEEGQTTEAVTGYPNTTPVKSFEHEDHTTLKPSDLPTEEQVTSGGEFTTGLPEHETEASAGTAASSKPSELVTEPTVHAETTKHPEYTSASSGLPEFTTEPLLTELPEEHVPEGTKTPELPTEQTPQGPITEGIEQATGTPQLPALQTEHPIPEEGTLSPSVTGSVPQEEHIPEHTAQPTEHPDLVTEEAPKDQVTEGIVHITGTPSKPSELVTEPVIHEEETTEAHITEGLPQQGVTEVSEGPVEHTKQPITGEEPEEPSTEAHEIGTPSKPSEFVTEHVTPEEQTPAGVVTETVPHREEVPGSTEGITPSTEQPKEGQVTGTTEGPAEITEQAISITKEPLEGQPGITEPIEGITEAGTPEEQTPTAPVTEGVPHEVVPGLTEEPVQTEQPEGVTKLPSEGQPIGTTAQPSDLVIEPELPEGQTPAAGITEIPQEEHVPEHTEGPLKSTEYPEVTKQPSEGVVTEGIEHTIPEGQTPTFHVTEKIPEEEHIPEATGRPEYATEPAPEGIEHVTGTVPEGVETAKPTESATEGVPQKEEGQTTEVTGYPNTTPAKTFEYEDHTTSGPSEFSTEKQVTAGVEYATGLPEHETEGPGVIEHITEIPSKPSEGVTEGQATGATEQTTSYPSEHSTKHGAEPESHVTGPIEQVTGKVPEEGTTLKPEVQEAETVAPGIEGEKPTGIPEVSLTPEEETTKKETEFSPEAATTPSPTGEVSPAASVSPHPSDILTNETGVPTTPSAQYPHVTEPVAESSSAAPDFADHTPEIPDYHLPQEEEYEEEEQGAFGPGTCRYGGKVYVSAQQIPRDDPCDFCFCFRSDIICLQQSCPPPIPRCHEEPIRGFCCPRYECPVSMATTVNITTTTTTTTTTLPPHFFSHAYKGRATRQGCQIQGQAYQVGEEVPSASGPCLQCKCGGDGQMKCDPKACSPEPMLRKMIAEVASRRRR